MVFNESQFGYSILFRYFDEEVQTIAAKFRSASKYSERLYRRVVLLILTYCPQECTRTIFGKNCKTRLKMENLMNNEMLKYVELDFHANSKVMAKALVKCTSSSMKVFEYKIFLLLANKGIFAYLSYFDGEYLKSFTEFRECLQFIYYIKQFGPEKCQIYSFLDDCERMFSILCATSLMAEIEGRRNSCVLSRFKDFKLDEVSVLQGLFFTVIDCTDPSLMTAANDLDRYVLGRFFESLGEIERSIAIYRGSLAEYECKPNVNDLALRVQKDHLGGMIRRYILAMTIKLSDDPAIIRCLYSILEGLVLYGGVHMEVIWFFYSLKVYYEVAMESSEEFLDKDLTKECVMMLNLVCQKWQQIRKKYKPRTVQLPQILLKSMFGDFVIVDEVFEENNPFEHHHELSVILSSIKLKAKHKWFGEVNAFEAYSDSMWKTGMEWVDFWKDCYLDNHSELPVELLVILEGTK